MTVYYRVYSDTADSGADGVDATYLTARAATTATTSAASWEPVGQILSAGTYTVSQAFMQFDTSSVPAGGAGSIAFYAGTSAAGISGDTLEFREVSSVANKIAGASISGNTMIASLALTGSEDLKHQMVLLTTDPARGAAVKVLLNTAREVAATAPTVNETIEVYLANQTGRSWDPFIQYQYAPQWTFVDRGTNVEISAGTSHTLTEPSGAQQGDLIVACISSRIASTTSITLPTGNEWTLVSEQKNDNTLTTTSALASGMMAYCIRGASAPNYVFTHPAVPSVAQGRAVAYRGVYTANPLDASTSFTTAVNTTAVSGTGMTTTQDDDLIVAMFAGGQEAAVTLFAAATSPTDNSGTSSLSLGPPRIDGWLERAETITTTGADTSLSVFDAVKSTTGATGNLTCTASLGAGHVVVAGAFRLAPRRNATIVNVSFGAVTRSASW